MKNFGKLVRNGSPDSKKYKTKKNLAKNIKQQKKHYETHSKFIPQSPVKGQSNKSLSKINQTQKSLQQVQVSEHYTQLKTKQGNLIWSGATSIAFRQFCKAFLHTNKLKLKNQDQVVRKTLQGLNCSKFYKKNLSQECFYVKSGVGIQAVKTINKQVLQKFPHKTTEALSQDVSEDNFISYSYLFKALEYKQPFERQPGMLWFGQPAPDQDKNQPYMVQAFAAIQKQCLEQVKIVQYKDPYNFIIGFKAKASKNKGSQSSSTNHQIHHYPEHLKQQKTFVKNIQSIKNHQNFKDVIYILSFNQKQTHHNITIHQVIKKIIQIQKDQKIDQRKNKQNLVQFVMPVIDLDIHHQFQEFQGLQIQNQELKGKYMKMVENIKLKMDQKGVVIQQQAFISKDQCCIVGDVEIIVNQPFWLVLTEEGKHPYLVAKINWLPEKMFKESPFGWFGEY